MGANSRRAIALPICLADSRLCFNTSLNSVSENN
jgi:hypothetical protein